jgi:nucleotide sugar dehydrogenase
MAPISIIGQGFVGTAVREGLRHAFEIWTFDKKEPWLKIHSNVGEKSAAGEPIKMIADNCEIVFICVPTPMKSDGSCDTSIVESVINELAQKTDKPLVVTIKSTVPPGTCERLNALHKNIVVCFNPEFLTERNSIQDFKNQDRIIIGGPREGTNKLKAMYERAYPNVPTTKTSSTIAEMVKYVTNCFLATKVAFANEISQICGGLNIDYDKVIEYSTKDKRLGGSHWSVPGPDGLRGYGGSCFPKDINALISVAKKLGVDPIVMESAWKKNLEVRPGKDWEQLKGRAVS